MQQLTSDEQDEQDYERLHGDDDGTRFPAQSRIAIRAPRRGTGHQNQPRQLWNPLGQSENRTLQGGNQTAKGTDER